MTKDSCDDIDATALIVDDNESNLLVLSRLLESYGVCPDLALSGAEAVEKTCAINYDFILVDYLMPEMDGVETTRKIVFVSDPEKIPKIIGVSATINHEVERLFKNAGADRVIAKPVMPEELEECAGHYLDLDKKRELDLQQEKDFSGEADQYLHQVSGLDYKKGMRKVSVDFPEYIKILKVCVSNIQDNIAHIDAVYLQDDWSNSMLYFHSLKGIFLNIEAKELADLSKEMELAARESRWEAIRENIDFYVEQVRTFNQQLREACESYQKEKGKKSAIISEGSDEEWQENIQKLYEHIEDYEYMEIVDLLESMMLTDNVAHIEKLKKIDDFIQAFQYEEALEYIKNGMK